MGKDMKSWWSYFPHLEAILCYCHKTLVNKTGGEWGANETQHCYSFQKDD